MVAQILWTMAGMTAVAAAMRLGFLFFCRRPTLARAVSNDYGEAQRLRDRDMRIVAQFDNIPTEDDIPMRGVAVRVDYVVADITYRADIDLPTWKGERAADTMVVWYDPAAPERVTGHGPRFAMVALLAAGGLGVLAAHCPL